jgi:hypothetical protein
LIVEHGNGMAFKTSRLSGTNSDSKSKAKAKTKYLMLPAVSRSAAYSHPEVFHDSKLPRPELYPPTSMSFSRATVPARADHGVVALSIGTIGMYGTTVPMRYLVFFLREALLRLFQQQEEEDPLEEEEWEGEREEAQEGEREEEQEGVWEDMWEWEWGWKEQEQEREPYVDMDWANWGPKTSRWFVAPSFEQSRCSVHGYRFVALVTRLEASIIISPSFTQAGIDIIMGTNDPPPDADADTDADTDTDAPLHLLVFDFNPYPLRRHQYSLGPPPIDNSPSFGNGNTVVISPSDVTFHNQMGRFEAKVMGHLACRVTLMDECADYVEVAACEDNIIGFQVRQSQPTSRERA